MGFRPELIIGPFGVDFGRTGFLVGKINNYFAEWSFCPELLAEWVSVLGINAPNGLFNLQIIPQPRWIGFFVAGTARRRSQQAEAHSSSCGLLAHAEASDALK